MKSNKMKTLNENPIVFLDIGVSDEKIGRVIIELFSDKVPKTAENFRCLCTGEKGIGTKGKPLHYKGTIIHKLIPHLMILGGDIINFDGSSGESIYGPYFGDENLKRRHDSEGLLSMVNEGKPHTNSSQFVISMSSCPQLNNTNVVFGKVLKGMGVVNELNNVQTEQDKPVEKINIIDCGELTHNSNSWGLEESDGTEDTYTPYPEDWNYSSRFENLSHDNVLQIVNKIKTVGNACFSSKNYLRAERKYKKALRYFEWMLKNELSEDKQSFLQKNDANINELKVAILLNLAACKLQQSKYREALNYSNQALLIDKNSSKGLFRRAQAHVGLNEYELGIADLKAAYEDNPNNKDIQNEIIKVKKTMQSYLVQEKAACKRMFTN